MVYRRWMIEILIEEPMERVVDRVSATYLSRENVEGEEYLLDLGAELKDRRVPDAPQQVDATEGRRQVRPDVPCFYRGRHRTDGAIE